MSSTSTISIPVFDSHFRGSFSRAAQSLRCHPIPHRLLSQGLVLRASLALERVKIEGKTGKIRSLRQSSHRSPRTAFCRQMSSPGRRGSRLHHPKRGFFRQRSGPRAITRGYPIRGAVPRAIHRIPAGLHSLRGRSGAGDGNDSCVRAVRGIRSVRRAVGARRVFAGVFFVQRVHRRVLRQRGESSRGRQAAEVRVPRFCEA